MNRKHRKSLICYFHITNVSYNSRHTVANDSVSKMKLNHFPFIKILLEKAPLEPDVHGSLSTNEHCVIELGKT